MSWPLIIFLYDLFIVGVLGVLAVCQIEYSTVHPLVPEAYRLPVYGAWFGALGGVVISLKGVYDHQAGGGQAHPWQDRYNLWHLGRPVSGAITGLVTYVLLQALNPSGKLTEPVVYAAAFVLGTQERRFFSFLYEVARIVVQVPGEQDATGLQIAEVHPSQGHAGDVLVVRGRGFLPGVVIRFDNVPLDHATVAADGSTVAGIVPQHAQGPVDVIAVNSNGSALVRARGFTYL